ncbi:hypothetical protein [Acidaminobacter hydrogenoformans]|uniref:Homoserine dehydrogenase n=1 Tax=Acidaminobacter hydrogenoformans DSM 2784 TaxID=1120920 RepID=A0A1G5S6V3_9FIRM|nr:hypothetical protein [Acidaminobacter hydrogenoformans]SCZ82102.1 homoserine dehydrogenase [Acidaminobacter hydrogenoformans DSM 2784]
MKEVNPSHNPAVSFPLCLIGFGNAGQAFCQMLLEQHDHVKGTYGVDLQIVAISTRSKGTLFDPRGLDLSEVLTAVREGGRLDHRQSALTDVDPLGLIQKCGAKAMLELSTLSIEDGQPAISHIETAFENGMHVITANKGPLAWAYSRLKALADSKGLELLHETTVMDGAPVFNLAKETLPGCKVLGFKGILNSTTNFVLERMEAGDNYDEALQEAKRQGFAEADPSLDIDGWDAAAKTSALINVLMAGSTTPLTIDRTGIAEITLEDITAARERGGKLKLICEGILENGEAKGSVKPVFVSNQDMFSTIDATTSTLCLKTDLMGEICMVERQPEIQQTAYGVFSDTLTLIRRLKASGSL